MQLAPRHTRPIFSPFSERVSIVSAAIVLMSSRFLFLHLTFSSRFRQRVAIACVGRFVKPRIVAERKRLFGNGKSRY
jgi:hypothetical protein